MSNSLHKLIIESLIGRLTLISDGSFLLSIMPTKIGDLSDRDSPEILKAAQMEIQEYFEGKRHTFTLPLLTQGTPFQKRVWQVCSEIPYGEVISYKLLAIRVAQNQKYARAVANALHRNPIPLIIPCHRVVGSNGSLTGFAWGVAVKSELLSLENPNLIASHQKIPKRRVIF